MKATFRNYKFLKVAFTHNGRAAYWSAIASERCRRQAVHTMVWPSRVPSPDTRRATCSVGRPHSSHGMGLLSRLIMTRFGT